MNNSTTKAVRATIYLGVIPLEVFQLPSGEYILSQAQVCEAVGKHPSSISEFVRSKSPEALPYKGLQNRKTRVADSDKPINAVPIELATAYWTKEALSVNISAIQLLGACAAEAIERRADAAFGVQRKEEDRQAFMKARMAGKVTRRSFTDAIADYLDRHSELSEDCRKWIYVNSSDAVNLTVFNRRAWELCDERSADKHYLRDSFTQQELLLVQEVEDVAMRLVDRDDIHPPTAVRQAGARLLIGKNSTERQIIKSKPVKVLAFPPKRR